MKGLVHFDLTNHLRKGTNLGNARDGVFWVDFRYEKIPRCCYMCGVFGHDETECATKKKAEDKGEEFIPRELGSWLKAEFNGKKIEWSGTKKQRGSKDDREDVHRVGTVKRVDTKGLMEKLAQLSVKEKRTTFINLDSETLIMARDHGVAHGGKTMESDGVTSEKTRGGEDDKTPKTSGGNTRMANKNANPDQDKTITRVVKGGVTTWKRMAREKENLVPVEVIKKRMFHDLTNAMECSEEDVHEGGKKARQGDVGIDDSLLGKSLKAKYFRNGTFMEAGLGCNPSFTWRSILHGREVLKKGLIRRIGDGVKTNLFNTQWIPSIENFSIPYTNQQMGLDATVNMLIMQDSKRWNVPLIMQNFEPTIAKAILSIPLSKTGAVDVWMWKFSNNGVFNVKSAYKAIHKSYETSNGWRVYKLGLWRDSRIGMGETNETSFIEWLKGQMEKLSTKDFDIMCIMMHKVWDRRNKITIGDVSHGMDNIWEEAKKLWRDFNEETRTNLNPIVSAERVCWTPPHWSRVKVNVDASMNTHGEGKIGCVIRNFSGRCLAAKIMFVPGINTIELLEAIAVYEGACFAKDMSCTKIEVEGDCKKVFDLLTSKNFNLSYLGLIIENILALKSDFDCISFNWVPREANVVAHTLAKTNFNFPDVSLNSHVWLEDFSSVICNVLLSDCS
ncbi:uncharacterized protein G2W53_003614 [Senna tora]|uniref:RNase H type-1 domain-containing protein n=1 Tax=Senna tora TaxID=362788 RepID=A0A835CFW4_9FABA|nr:uncharacterized protein G2W53_003614 [Senna tora]